MKHYFLNHLQREAAAGAGGGAAPAEDKRTEAELLVKIQELVTRSIKDVATKEELKAITDAQAEGLKDVEITQLRAMADDKTGVMSTVAKQGLEIQRLQTSVAAKEKGQDMSIRGQIKSWMDSNKAVLDAARSSDGKTINAKKLVDLPELQLRAAITMMEGTQAVPVSLGGSYFMPRPQVAPGVIDLVRTQPTFWDYLPKGNTKANPYIWINKTNKQGNAAFIGEGVLKPLASFELSSESSTPKKVAERMKMSNELLYDVDGFASLVEGELAYEVKMAANAATFAGVGSSTAPKGISNYGTTYVSTAIKTLNPNNMDAIRAAKAVLYNLNFRNNIVAFVNPIDAANMEIAKASTSGVYLLPPFTSVDGKVIAGVPVVEEPTVPIGYLLIGDLSRYKILMYQDFFISWGWENDDFSKNLTTVIGEMRFHQFFPTNYTGAIIYDTFANIKTLLT